MGLRAADADDARTDGSIMKRSHILGLGHHVPERIVTNAELETMMDTSDEWIRQRSGIEERRWIDEGSSTTASDLAVPAARQALAEAGRDVSDVDLIIFATLSPDAHFPGSGCFLQRELELHGIPTLDIRQQCTGFIYGLAVADAFIKAGQYECILLVGGEVHSTGLERATRGRDVTVLFGDGAAAAVMGPVDDGRGLLATALHSDGRYAEDLWMPCPASRITVEDIQEGRHWPQMNGRKVFKQAVTLLPEVLFEVLDATGKTIDDIDLLVPHQANLRINEAAAKAIGFPPEKMFNNIQKYGNTTAATIPLALHEAFQQGAAHEGDLIAFIALGSGLTWASALMQF